MSLARRFAAALWYHSARWLVSKGMEASAETSFRYAASLETRNAGEASFRLAQLLLGRREYVEAESICERAILLDNNEAKIWCALGAARRRLAKMEAARQAYEKAIEIDPRYAPAWSNLGEWYLVKGQFANANDSFLQAIELNPELLEAMNNRVAVLYELGKFEESVEVGRQAIKKYPFEAALHVNLGNVLLHSGKARLAIKSYYKALELDPSSPQANMGLATLLGENHRLAETIAFFEHEIAILGESAQRLASLALAQQANQDWPAAEQTCRKVLEMQPSNLSAMITLAGCLSVRADHPGAIELERKALATDPRMPSIRSNIAFEATYIHGLSVDDVFAFHREWADQFEQQVMPLAMSGDRLKHPDRPLRIGYVSGDFGRHPVGFLLRDVIRHHDGKRFYIHCYSMMRRSDDITLSIREGADSWIEGLLMSDEELAAQIQDDQIDILVDLSGHTAYNRLPVFVRRPAPIQATWIGYFHSTGLASIDYFITDPHTSPSDSPQMFSEIPVFLPNSRFCYSPPEYAPGVVAPPHLNVGHITFGSFNRSEKLVDPVLSTWVSIVNATPGSRLVIKAGSLRNEGIRKELLARFRDFGLDSNRLDLRGPSGHQEMLAEYGEIDIALDTFPFNGGMTTLEALWMGVPVVTLMGDGIVSRQTCSALANIDLLDELAFPTLDAYVQGALHLAGNSARLLELREQLRKRLVGSPICQAQDFVRDLEALYRQMWHAYCRGERLPSVISQQTVGL
jgi:protein O-GlcNAc transferase